jgi:hypothetical protein
VHVWRPCGYVSSVFHCGGKLALNVFNTRGVRSINEAGEEALGTPSPAYGQPVASSLQAPRRVRLLAQYEF